MGACRGHRPGWLRCGAGFRPPDGGLIVTPLIVRHIKTFFQASPPRFLLQAFIGLSIAGGIALGASPALAAGQGQLQAVASGDALPAGAAVALVPGDATNALDDAKLYRAAKKAIGAGLRKQGIAVSANAPLKLTFDIVESSPSPPRRDTVVAPRTEPREVPDVVNQVDIPLTPQPPDDMSDLSVNFYLYDRDQTTLWSATVSASGDITDPERLIGRLCRFAMAKFGSTAQADFRLQCSAGESDDTICLP